jgi:tetratricopeptide (TPR) repeat protein
MNVLEMNPGDGYANFNMGLYHIKKNEPDEAIEHLAKTRESGVHEGDAVLYLGIAYKQKGNLGRATIYLLETIDKRHRILDARLHLSEVYIKSNLPGKAEQQIGEVLGILTQDKERFQGTIHRMTKGKELHHVEPSAEIILPLISKVLDKKSMELNEWKNLVDGKLNNRQGINEP